MRDNRRRGAELRAAASELCAGPRVVCLLPVRNAAHLLPDWLEEAKRFSDAVVALDDGSTDSTGDVLRSHPLVATVLTNEPRSGHLGWHDGRNRNRLLAAAGAFQPEWIFWLDADERLDPTDAEALRRFVATEALAACAYGFKVYRRLADGRYDPQFEWVFRLFRYRPGQQLTNRRFDFVPVPTAIPPEAWVLTTIRIQHFGEVDERGRQSRVAKYREGDPEGAFREYYENLRPFSTGPYPRWAPRNPAEPLLLAATEPTPSTPRPEVVCLLPARDCARHLPAYLESVARFADAVIALDDGSTDETLAILRGHPLVVKVLTNPPHPGFGEWDDGENRNRLLAAAAELSPRWVISLDADERIPLEDGVALRRFLREEAEPGYGYAFASYRMIGDEDHYDRLDYWACRLFAFEPGHVFPSDRFHAPPIPTAIPRDRWRPTSIRFKHLASLTEADRRARWEKYQQADPECRWEPDYAYTIEAPGEVKPWPVRPLGLPAASTWEATLDPVAAEVAALDLNGPVLSLAVVVEPVEEHEAVSMLSGLVAAADPRLELLAVTRDTYAAGVLRRASAEIRVIEVVPDLTGGALRNEVLRVARGDYVTFSTMAGPIRFGDLMELLAAHESGHAIVCARVTNLTPTAPGRADFFLSCSQARLDGASPGDLAFVSFAREPLLGIGGFDPRMDRGFEPAAAQALLEHGFTTTVAPTIVLGRSSASTVTELLRHRYQVGRGLASNRDGGRSLAVARRTRPGREPSRRDRAGERRLPLLEPVLGSTPPVVAGLIALGAAATWLGAVGETLNRRRPAVDRQRGVPQPATSVYRLSTRTGRYQRDAAVLRGTPGLSGNGQEGHTGLTRTARDS